MPFSSLSDPVDTARALSAWEAAWERVKDEQILMLGSEEAELMRLKFIIASLVPFALDEGFQVPTRHVPCCESVRRILEPWRILVQEAVRREGVPSVQFPCRLLELGIG